MITPIKCFMLAMVMEIFIKVVIVILMSIMVEGLPNILVSFVDYMEILKCIAIVVSKPII